VTLGRRIVVPHEANGPCVAKRRGRVAGPESGHAQQATRAKRPVSSGSRRRWPLRPSRGRWRADRNGAPA
jgi:hypothetical protein